MTVLSACQGASVELSQPEPGTLFTTDDSFAKELRLQANRTAVAVMKAHDWQKLKTIHTITGDGTTTAFALPADYDRMLKNTEFFTSSFGWVLRKAGDENEWLDFQINTPVVGPPGYWNIVGGQIEILPALASGDQVKFYYIKNEIVTPESGDAKTAFTGDGDSFVLPERLIEHGVVWRWRASKRMEYAEDLHNFEVALAEEIGADKGSRVLKVGRTRYSDIQTAYPGSLGS